MSLLRPEIGTLWLSPTLRIVRVLGYDMDGRAELSYQSGDGREKGPRAEDLVCIFPKHLRPLPS